MICICYGTRPEVIKLSPVIRELEKRQVPFITVFTGQHDSLYRDVADLVPIPDYHFAIMKKRQSPSYVLSAVMTSLAPVLVHEKVKLLIVQGDTSTVLGAALTAFYLGIKIGHVEAGLRTYDLASPFPEEANRQLVSRIAAFHWAPTPSAGKNLEQEGVKDYEVVGNTVIDACKQFNFPVSFNNEVLLTLHRRENAGHKTTRILQQVEQLAKCHPHLRFIFPLHPSLEIDRYRHLLKRIVVLAPLPYRDLLILLSKVRFVISDSGGIQEECSVFRKRILVCRNTTERPEGVAAGLAKIVGHKIIKHFEWANQTEPWKGESPYGDGLASKRIVDAILNHNW